MCLVRVILSFPNRRHKTYLNVTQTAQGVWSRPNKILMIKYRMNNIKHLVVIKSIDTYTCINFVRNRICLYTNRFEFALQSLLAKRCYICLVVGRLKKWYLLTFIHKRTTNNYKFMFICKRK